MELVSDNPNRWLNMLANRSDSAIRAVLDSLVGPGSHVSHVEGHQDILTGEHIWAIRWDCAAPAWKAHQIYSAVVRFHPTRDINPMTEFYRRAEKRLKLFAELVRD